VDIESPVQIRITLRPDLVFSDGSALDATDVIATFESVVDRATRSRYAETYRRIERMDSPDARTIVFHLGEPHAPFVTDLEFPILRAEDAHTLIGARGDREPIGAGPYRLLEREPGRIELVANPRWYAAPASNARVRLLTVREENTRAMRMLGGGGDLVIGAMPPLLVPLFRPENGFTVRSVPGPGTTYLGFRTDAGVLSDVRVRRAIAHAIDLSLLRESKLGTMGAPAQSWIPEGHWAETPELPGYAFDLARARALLDDAGLVDPDGPGPRMRASLVLRSNSDAFRLSVARAIAAMLREAEIEVEVRPSENATFLSDLDRGRFELTLLQVPELFEPHLLDWFFGGASIPSGIGSHGANRWRFRSAALDRALEQGRAETERGARRASYAEAQRILLDQLPVLPLWHDPVITIAGPRAASIAAPADGRLGVLARQGRAVQ